MIVGVLALQGDVEEHVCATGKAAERLGLECEIIEVRTAGELERVSGLVIPGGESTTFYKLCERGNLIGKMREVDSIFGTCAGTIFLAKRISNSEAGQKTLGLMDIVADRNGYGRQADSFEEEVETKLGRVRAVFIRAPRIAGVGSGVEVLAERNGEVVACEEKRSGKYYLASCFHPELTNTKFHEHFLRNIP